MREIVLPVVVAVVVQMACGCGSGVVVVQMACGGSDICPSPRPRPRHTHPHHLPTLLQALGPVWSGVCSSSYVLRLGPVLPPCACWRSCVVVSLPLPSCVFCILFFRPSIVPWLAASISRIGCAR